MTEEETKRYYKWCSEITEALTNSDCESSGVEISFQLYAGFTGVIARYEGRELILRELLQFAPDLRTARYISDAYLEASESLANVIDERAFVAILERDDRTILKIPHFDQLDTGWRLTLVG